MAKTKLDTERLRVLSPAGRLAFPHLFEPTLVPGGREEVYNCVLVFEPDVNLDELKAAVRYAADAAFPDGEWQRLRKLNKFRLPFRRAEEYETYGEPFDVPDRIFISASSRERPGVVDQRVKPIIDQSEMYAGCFARARLYTHPYNTAGNAGVTFFLNNIQKVKDGPRLSGRRSAEEDFAPVEGGGDSGSDPLGTGEDELF